MIIQAKASTTQREKTNERRDAHRHFFGWLPIAAYARPDGFSPVTRIVPHHFRKSQYDEDYSVYQATHASKKDALAIFTPLTAFIRANHLDLLERCFKNCLIAFPIFRVLRLGAIITVAPASGKSQARSETVHLNAVKKRINTSGRTLNSVRLCREKNILKRQPIRQRYDLFTRALQGLFSFRIAAILGSIDEKIELNRKKIAELEALAKTIYDYWFVQFDFPDKNGKPYKSSGGKMVWNEQLKREIPDGWEVGTVGELGEIVAGGTPSTDNPSYWSQNGIAWITPKDLSLTNNKYIRHGEHDISEEGLRNSSAQLMPSKSVLLSTRAPIGYIAVADCDICTNQGFKSIVPNGNYGSEFIYYSLSALIPYIKTLGVGSTFDEVSKSALSVVQLVFPMKEIVMQFENVASQIGNNRIICELATEKLIRLRDTLLPLLMNGQVEVK